MTSTTHDEDMATLPDARLRELLEQHGLSQRRHELHRQIDEIRAERSRRRAADSASD